MLEACRVHCFEVKWLESKLHIALWTREREDCGSVAYVSTAVALEIQA
jgi:hypothetical protein